MCSNRRHTHAVIGACSGDAGANANGSRWPELEQLEPQNKERTGHWAASTSPHGEKHGIGGINGRAQPLYRKD